MGDGSSCSVCLIVNKVSAFGTADCPNIKFVQLYCKTLRSLNAYTGKSRHYGRASTCQQSELVGKEYSAISVK